MLQIDSETMNTSAIETRSIKWTFTNENIYKTDIFGRVLFYSLVDGMVAELLIFSKLSRSG